MNNSWKLWNKLLGESPKGAVLMGGAVVDWACGHKPKDFDIFYTYKPGLLDNLPPNWKMTKADFNDPAWVAQHDAWYQQGIDANGENPILSVIEYMVDGQHLVQLIGVKYPDPKTHFLNFDHSLTLGCYSKNGLFVHREVYKSLENHQVRYVSKNKTLEARARSLLRAQRKTQRYGNQWSFIGFDKAN